MLQLAGLAVTDVLTARHGTNHGQVPMKRKARGAYGHYAVKKNPLWTNRGFWHLIGK